MPRKRKPTRFEVADIVRRDDIDDVGIVTAVEDVDGFGQVVECDFGPPVRRLSLRFMAATEPLIRVGSLWDGGAHPWAGRADR